MRSVAKAIVLCGLLAFLGFNLHFHWGWGGFVVIAMILTVFA